MPDLLSDSTGSLARLPTFELCYVYDDDVDPTHVTVFAESDGGFTTRWITMDVDSAVALEQVA